MRLRRSDPSVPGYRRRRRGRGVTFLDSAGRPITDSAQLRRLRDLAIPPAWREVWISSDPRGHIQATGIDEAGRKQYLYHPVWRQRRDREKFAHVLEVAGHLGQLRKQVENDLRERGLTRSRVLAAITRLLDLGMFRIGGDQYAAGEAPTFGVATLRPEHARRAAGCVVLEFPAKGGVEQSRRVTDPDLCQVLRDLRRRRRGRDRLFGYWARRRWWDVRAEDVNEYLREASGTDMTAKDFRTWHATVLAATRLAAAGPRNSEAKRRRVVAGVMREVAELLGNTPAVARASYVDPRLLDLYRDGRLGPLEGTSGQAAEQAVPGLLGG
ncbi:DNA topoisomerase IB [Plantactinospora sp. KLBMP9567]|uniref:DNA topoisomerase IB n=1 Tax=Plantactinospora sp. KLBMP9567 TaxID=3085900 RepID=UPI002981DA9A|nr:DNA topoisomerase IB [Plantactinospora sp. KLBMP9567]MDW5322396.1 DNA topoisomerase IB [Plantactinospora sp. KLBMP9567]